MPRETSTRGRARVENDGHSAQKIGKQRIRGRVLVVSGGPPRLLILSKALLFILSNASRGTAVCVAPADARRRSTVSPFLRNFPKLPPLNLHDTPYLTFFSRSAACAAAV